MPEFRLTENIVGFVDLLEHGFLAFVFVRVVLLGEEVKLLFDLLEFCLLVNSQNLIVVFVEVNEVLIRSVSKAVSADLSEFVIVFTIADFHEYGMNSCYECWMVVFYYGMAGLHEFWMVSSARVIGIELMR